MSNEELELSVEQTRRIVTAEYFRFFWLLVLACEGDFRAC